MNRKKSRKPVVSANEDRYLCIKKLEYIIRFFKYYKNIKRSSVEDSLFEFSLKELSQKEQKEIINLIIKGENKTADNENIISEAADKLAKSGIKNKQPINKIIYFLSRKLLIINTEKYYSFYKIRFNELKTFFDLNSDEFELLHIISLLSDDEDFKYFFTYSNSIHRKVNFISACLDKSSLHVYEHINEKSKLIKYEIINSEIEIERHIVRFLLGLSSKPLSSKYYSVYKNDILPIQNFKKQTKHIDILTSIIKNKKDNEGINILLYGQPGTGKTEFSRSLSRHLNKQIYEINHFDEDCEPLDDKQKFTAYNICRKIALKNRDIIIIDEADQLLNGSGGFMFFDNSRNKEKNIINKTLDESQHVSIWITNEYRFIDESTRRRFDYSIRFEKLKTEERKIIWSNTLKKYNIEDMFSGNDIVKLAAKYDVSAGGINIAIKNSLKIIGSQSLNIMDAIDTVLNPHQELMNSRAKIQNLSNNYSLEIINTKGIFKISSIIEIASKFYESLDAGKNTGINNMNILLYGVPGTGKTEFVKYLAETIEKDVIIKTGADLLDMYVGETEHNIRDAFREAENRKAILFIDEVDGIFSNRKNSQRSWEITQVNELLTQMENFKGIFISATNFQSNIDSAALRRFNLKIEFDYLDNSGKKNLFDRQLGNISGKGLTKDEEEMLYQVNTLTPGDFKVVWQKHFFINKGSISNIELIKSLQEEINAKNSDMEKTIGFTR